ncbi:MAG TPA: TonB-dependent receptor, partial [Porticoccus sp.]|nr:TonB-dependent receptor [Porticoccus sp.]
MNSTLKTSRVISCSRGKLALAIAFVSVAPVVANAAVLEEVIITAQKQEQRIMEIPISVSAVTGEKINEAGINNLADMSGFVPGLHIGKGPINTTINIRGIGSGIDRGFEQSVGMYIDGIYMGRARQFRSPFLDTQRVEVLRGPQGILFGKNTIAGAINIISQDPSVGGETEGSISVKAEEFGTLETTGIYSTSITDTLAARVALKYRESDGDVDNNFENRDEAETEETSARLTVLWEPSDQLSLNTKMSYSDYSTAGVNAVPTSLDPVAGNLDPLAGAAFALSAAVAPDQNLNGSHDTWRNDQKSWASLPTINGWGDGTGIVPEQTDTQSYNMGVTAAYEFDSGWTFHSVSAVSGYETDDAIDADFSPIRLLLTRDQHEFEQVSQEFRFTYLEGGPFEFIGGAYIERQELEIKSGTFIDGTMDGVVPDSL